jgi:hypothetical protein
MKQRPKKPLQRCLEFNGDDWETRPSFTLNVLSMGPMAVGNFGFVHQSRATQLEACHSYQADVSENPIRFGHPTSWSDHAETQPEYRSKLMFVGPLLPIYPSRRPFQHYMVDPLCLGNQASNFGPGFVMRITTRQLCLQISVNLLVVEPSRPLDPHRMLQCPRSGDPMKTSCLLKYSFVKASGSMRQSCDEREVAPAGFKASPDTRQGSGAGLHLSNASDRFGNAILVSSKAGVESL